MRINSETEFNKLLKESGRKGFYLLWGSEDFLISSWTKKLVKPFEEEGGFNYTELDGTTLDLNDLFDATQQLPIFADQKCVVVKDFDVKKLVADDVKSIEEIIENLPPETILVISCRPDSLEARSGNGKKLLTLADKQGVAAEFSARDTAGLTKFLISSAKSKGTELSPENARAMIQLCGNEMLILSSEIDKVSSYVGTGEITMEDIEKVVVAKVEERVFDLSKAILSVNAQRAMEIVSGLIYQRESPIGIISILIMSYADMYRAFVAKKAGKNVNEAAAVFDYKGREFRLRNAFGIKISRNALEKSLDILYNCEKQMKSTALDQELLLEKAVMELISVRELE